MSDPVTSAPGMVRLTPDRRYTAAAAAGLLVALVLVLVAGDAPTRVLFGVAAVVLAAYVGCDLVFSPRVEAGPAGVLVRSPLTRASLPWERVDHVRADVSMRHGLRSTTLEIDAGEVLAVLSRRSIGLDPERAAELIRACRPAQG
ncbi:PH domain-containing protein [Jatrophihabitans endophyticus]|uniref:PH domain-containing protein n=1 Tax=Jatrophihabitans endophyticus TaxID=1206085 RepID=UPI001A03DFF9|nr:PH domain-containing protein [Jatrophihabitans endophyticus]MBE7189603.1 PH domain-containing protein [Jatrophihabitans endophyticus]